VPKDYPKSRLRKAVLQLGRFYGINGTGGIGISNLPPGQFTMVNRGSWEWPEWIGGGEEVVDTVDSAGEDSLSRLQGTFSAICGSGESTPTTAGILKENVEFLSGDGLGDDIALNENTVLSLAGPMLVYPDKFDVEVEQLSGDGAMGMLHAGYGKALGSAPAVFQGAGSPELAYFTTADMMPNLDDDMAKTLPKCTAIQIFPPAGSPSHTQSDIVSLFLNGIPPSEMNLCVPYLEVAILASYQPHEADEGSETIPSPPMSSYKWILGDLAKDVHAHPAGGWSEGLENMALAEWQGFPNGKSTKLTQEQADIGASQFSAIGGMDLFTWPQSLVNADRNSTSFEKNGIHNTAMSSGIKDPFRPFMSVLSFKTKTLLKSQTDSKSSGAGGYKAIVDEIASLRLKLHDRSRLGEISGLVSPSAFNTTQICVTYGWSHPSVLHLDRPSDANASARFGDILGLMKVTKVYEPNNVRFSFEDSGEISIDVDLQTSVMGLDKHVRQITSGPSDEDTPADAYSGLLSRTNSVISSALFQTAGGSKKGTALIQTVLPSLTVDGTGYIPDTLEAKMAIRKFLDAIEEKQIVSEEDIAVMEKAFFRHDGTYSPKSPPSGIKALNALLSQFKQKPDPFLRPACLGNNHKKPGPGAGGGKNSTYASLGKLLHWFMISPLRISSTPREIQTIFYACNHNAGGAHDFNLASFPILMSDFEKGVKDIMKRNNNMSISDFVSFLEVLISNKTVGAYGRGPSRGKINANMKTIYDSENPLDSTFSPVRLSIKTEVVPSRETVTEYGAVGAPILKIHVYDEKTIDPGQRVFKDIFEALGKGMVFQPSKRNNSADMTKLGATPGGYPYCSNHGANYDQYLEKLGPDGANVVLPIDSSLTAKLSGYTGAQFATEVGDNFMVVQPDFIKIKSMLTELQPTIIYGGANTALERLQIQTIQNPAEKSLRTSSKKRGSELMKAGVARAEGEDPSSFTTMPVEADADMLGCPYLANGQTYYLDIGTGTDVDGVYMVGAVEHTVEPGGFKTKCKFTKVQNSDIDIPIDKTLRQIIGTYAKNLE